MNETAPSIDPSRAALLVMDYQSGIIANIPGAGELVSRIKDTIATARQAGVRIGYVRVAFTEDDYAAMPATNKGFSTLASSRRMHHEAPETQIHEDIAPQPGDIVVRKTRVGAFSTTDLDAQLRERKIDTLILAGLSTSGVVLSTVRDAADRDYRVYVLEDGSSDSDREVHELLTRKVFPRQAHVITLAELPGLLEAA
jgi:nicotinamidase-related amidase